MNTLNMEDDGSPIVLKKFKHGQLNPTYYVTFIGKEMVLRKKPVSSVEYIFHHLAEYLLWKFFEEQKGHFLNKFLGSTLGIVFGPYFMHFNL